MVCTDPKDMKAADDFFLATNFDKPRDTTVNKLGSNVTLINVMRTADPWPQHPWDLLGTH
jgi:hypothetical protein